MTSHLYCILHLITYDYDTLDITCPHISYVPIIHRHQGHIRLIFYMFEFFTYIIIYN